MFAFPCAFLVTLSFLRVAVVTGGTVARSSTWSPLVNVCGARVRRAGRAISFLVVVFAFALHLAFLERVDLHPIRSSSALVPFPADTVGFAPKFQEG